MLKASKKKFNGEMFDIYLGSVGQGKTLVMTEDYALPTLLESQDVFSSYWINWNKKNWHFFQDPEEFTELTNCLLIIDELGDIIDKWSWEVLDISIKKFFMYHRHRLVDIVGNTQDYGDIAVQPRRHITKYFMLEKHFGGKFVQRLWPNFPWVVIKTYEMTKNELMLLDKPVINRNEDEESVDTFKSIDKFRTWYKIKELYHFELDEYKQEWIHYYCPECGFRQGEQIPVEETFGFAERDKKTKMFYPRKDLDVGYCPKHPKQKLTIRTSTMYDSHYLPAKEAREIIFKPFVMGNKLIPFRGTLSPEQQELLKQLKSAGSAGRRR